MTIISKIKGTDNITYTIQDKTTSGVTAGSYGITETSFSHGGTFKVPYFTVNAQGKITAASNKTVKLPSDENTDTLAIQTATATSSSGNFPMLLVTGSGSPTNTTLYFSPNFYFTPSTQTLKTNVEFGFIAEGDHTDGDGSTGISYKSLSINSTLADVIHMGWDNTGGYDSQLGFTSNMAYMRGQNAGTWGPWYKLLTTKSLDLIDVSSRIQSVDQTQYTCLTKPTTYTVGHKTWSNSYSTTDFNLPSNSSPILGPPVLGYTILKGHIVNARNASSSDADLFENDLIPKEFIYQTSAGDYTGVIFVNSPNTNTGTLIRWGRSSIASMTNTTTINSNTMYYGTTNIDWTTSTDYTWTKKPNIFVQWASNYANLRALCIQSDNLTSGNFSVRGYAGASVSAERYFYWLAIGPGAIS